MKPSGSDMEHESPDEFHCIKRHDLADVPVITVLIVEHDLTVMHCNDAVVGDGYPVRISTEVVEHLFRSGKGLLGVDHPFHFPELADQFSESGWLAEMDGAAGKDKVLVAIGSLKIIDELAPEDTREALTGKRKCLRESIQRLRSTGERTCRYDTVQVVMIQKHLAPGMEDENEAHPASQRVPWIKAEIGQGPGHRLEEHGIYLTFIALGHRVDLMRESEYHMEVS